MKTIATITLKVEVETKDIGKDRVGTSLQGEIAMTYAELCQIFGPPNTDIEEHSQDLKTDVGWEGMIDGQAFLIYNYKDGPRYLGQAGTPITKLTAWNIGAHKQQTAKMLIAFIQLQRR